MRSTATPATVDRGYRSSRCTSRASALLPQGPPGLGLGAGLATGRGHQVTKPVVACGLALVASLTASSVSSSEPAQLALSARRLSQTELQALAAQVAPSLDPTPQLAASPSPDPVQAVVAAPPPPPPP